MKKLFILLALAMLLGVAAHAEQAVDQQAQSSGQVAVTGDDGAANDDAGLGVAEVERHHWVCWARNQWRMTFEGFSHHRRYAEEEALDRCHRHHRFAQCYLAGCEERWR
jgi:hypothetical protein